MLMAYLLDLEFLLITGTIGLGNSLALGGASGFLHFNVRHILRLERVGRFGTAWQVAEAGVGVSVHGITETDVDEAATDNRRCFRRTKKAV